MNAAGRHRAPGTLQSVSTALGVSTRPLAKASAVVVVTGGVVAALSGTAAAGAAHQPGAQDAAMLSAASTAGQTAVAYAPVSYAKPADHAASMTPSQLAAMRQAGDGTAALSMLAAKAPTKGVRTQDFGAVGFTGMTPVVSTQSVQRHITAVKSPTKVTSPTPPAPTPNPPSPTPNPPSPTPTPTPNPPSPTPTPNPPSPNPPAPGPHSGVLAIAAKYVGVPYVYGGSSPSGFDCSGFTSFVFAQVGIHLPRTAAGQQAAVQHVSSPQPGDLVFFGYPAYHVGIYAGNGQMYDAPKPGGRVALRSIWGGASFGRP